MKITALLPWFGSKRTLAPKIIDALGPHSTYWEPFCGSMAVLLAKPPSTMETVNDLHGDLVNLARVIRDQLDGPRLYRRLRRTLVVEELQHEARERLREETDPFDRAYWYFIESWLGRNGCSGTSSSNNGFCIRFTGGGGSPSVRFASAVNSIPAWRERLRRTIIVRKDSFWLLDKIADSSDVAIYIDPPYWEKGARYVHDFDAEDTDEVAGLFGSQTPRKVNHHRLLAETVSRFTRSRVVISYYDHPAVRALYPEDQWEWIDCAMTKALVNQGMRDSGGVTKAPEVLICNRRGVSS